MKTRETWLDKDGLSINKNLMPELVRKRTPLSCGEAPRGEAGTLRGAHCSFMEAATGSKGNPPQSKACHLAANEGERAKQFMLASLRALAASSDAKLAPARDKAQFVFTSLHGGMNIASVPL